MRTFLSTVSLLVGLLIAQPSGRSALAQPLPTQPTHYALGTNAQQVMLAYALSGPSLYSSTREQTPPRYNYRQARKVERSYHRHRRQYHRVNRRNSRQLRKEYHQTHRRARLSAT